MGTEVKSCRAGKIQIKDGYVRVDRDGQLKLFNVCLNRAVIEALIEPYKRIE